MGYGIQKMSAKRKEFGWTLKDRSVLDSLRGKGEGISDGRIIAWPKACRQGSREQKLDGVAEVKSSSKESRRRQDVESLEHQAKG